MARKKRSTKKKAASRDPKNQDGTGGDEAPMDERLWSNLPKDLLERVISRLPLHILFQARTISKAWNEIIMSSSFVKTYAEAPTRGSYVPMYISRGAERECLAYDFTLNRWQRLPSLSFLPRQVASYWVSTGAGGLLCFNYVSEVMKHEGQIVCNPLTGKWRELPRMVPDPGMSPLVFHMVAERSSKSYKVIVSPDSQVQNPYQAPNYFLDNTQVYDSRRGSWVVTGRPPLRLSYHHGSAYSKGFLYCVAVDNKIQSLPLGVISYNVATGLWSDVPSTVPKGFQILKIMECGSEVFLVTDLHAKVNKFVSVHIFKRDPTTSEFLHFVEMPQKLFLQAKFDKEFYDCVGEDEQICFTNFKRQPTPVYNLAQGTWSNLPSRPYLGNGDVYDLFRFCFQPNLGAVV